MTIDQEGNIKDFFENIIFVSLLMQPGEIQVKVSQALITRINFLKQDLESIFWTDNKTNDLFEIRGSLFFDLSQLNSFVTSDHLQILVNLILEIIILSDIPQTIILILIFFLRKLNCLQKISLEKLQNCKKSSRHYDLEDILSS